MASVFFSWKNFPRKFPAPGKFPAGESKAAAQDSRGQPEAGDMIHEPTPAATRSFPVKIAGRRPPSGRLEQVFGRSLSECSRGASHWWSRSRAKR